jgi:ABC-type multidrug transport system fused ATPase/permease subunit
MSTPAPNITASIANLPEIKVMRLGERLRRGILLMSADERKRAFWLFCSSVVNALLETTALVSIIPLILVMFGSSALSFEGAPSWLVQMVSGIDKKTLVLALGACVLVLICIKAIYAWAHTGWMARFFSRCEKRLSSLMMRQILTTHYKWLVRQNTARLRQISVGFVPYWSRQFVGTLLKLANDLMTGAIIVLVLIWANPISGFLVVAGVLLFASGIFLFVRPEHLRLAIAKRNASLGANRICTDVTLGAKEIKMAGAEDKISSIFDEHIARGADANAKDIQWMTIPRMLLEIIAYGGLVGVSIFIISFELQSAELSGLILLYGLSALRLIPIFSSLVSSLTRLLNTFPAIDDLCTLIAATASTELLPSDGRTAMPWQKISLEQVSFKYENTRKAAVQDVSLTIKRGQSYGVVGPSGAGKSTVIDMIAGLMEPTQGLIKLDDVPLTMDNRRFWRRRFGYVAQRPFLTDTTLRKNITFNFSSDADEERLERAIRLASLEQLVARLPNGSASLLGEQGNLLSGGERQRVAIARALYRGADILILDEATSSLDALVEHEIVKSIEKLRGVITTIIVSHRLGLVRNCDEIWLFDEARLSARGTHDELLGSSDLYRRMNMQSGRVSTS